MKRLIVVLVAVWSIGGMTRAYAQETTAGPAPLEVTVIPAGATYFTGGSNGLSFGAYTLGGALTANFNRIVGVEAEVSGAFSGLDGAQFGDLAKIQKTPSNLSYTGNLVVSVPTHASVVPYVTGGIGGFTMFEQQDLGLNRSETFLTGNVGGGVKWYAPNGRWGLRGDYRFGATQGKDSAPAFFGHDTRYGHRVYVGVVISAVR
jgi:hypothetical protein